LSANSFLKMNCYLKRTIIWSLTYVISLLFSNEVNTERLDYFFIFHSTEKQTKLRITRNSDWKWFIHIISSPLDPHNTHIKIYFITFLSLSFMLKIGIKIHLKDIKSIMSFLNKWFTSIFTVDGTVKSVWFRQVLL
jgi:hypothetical protein